jgi:hypothetical protein
MKNITLSVDDDIYYQARIKAAQKHSSVSRLVAEFLEQMVAEDDEQVNARKEMKLLFESNLGSEYNVKMTRDEMHED